MKRCIFLVGLYLLCSACAGQKSATIIIDTDQSSLPLINSVDIQKNDENIHTRFFNLKNILLKDLDSGWYHVKYITYFSDTIEEGIHIDRYDKFRISYPDNSFYQPTESPNPIIEYFLMNDVAEMKLYIKSNIFDYTFYHQFISVRKNQDIYKGYYSSHNYGPDTRKGISDTTIYLDIPQSDVQSLLEFVYVHQDSNNPNAYIRCNHFSEAYLMINRQYFYFNFCEDGMGEVLNLLSVPVVR
jgi:hypothetical protein